MSNNGLGIDGATEDVYEENAQGDMVPVLNEDGSIKQQPKDLAEYMGTLAVEALKRLGTPGDGIVDDNDLDNGEFNKALQKVYDEHVSRENQRKQLDKLKRETPEKIRDIRSTASQANTAALNRYKQTNGNLLRGE